MSKQLISLIVLLSLLWMGAILRPAAALNDGEPAGETAVILYQDNPEETEPTDGNISLFEGLGVIFAVLSVYIVTMFTMAIGTEILVDIIKGFFGKPLGLKSRPNARQKLEDYAHFLPGKLDDLGISAEARLKIERQLNDLKEILEPAFTAETAAYHFRREEITHGLNTLGIDWNAADSVDTVKEATQTFLNNTIFNIDVTTTLGQTVQRTLERGDIQKKADRAIDKIAKRVENRLTPELVYDSVAFVVSGEIADGVTAWTNAYLNSMQTKTYEAASSMYYNQLHPQIVGFNLGANLQKKIEDEFEQFLGNLKVYRGTDIYLASVNGFLLEVENQRNIVRSTAGRIRDWFIDLFKRALRLIPFVQHPALAPDKFDPLISDSSTAAAKLLELEEYDKEQNRRRIRHIRLLSFILGTLLAYLMQIDSADLLGELFSDNANFLRITLIPGGSFLLRWIPALFSMEGTFDLTAGVLLTGLAASAGSTFWHDQLTRIQAAKQGVEKVQTVVQPIIMEAQNNRSS